MDEIVNKEKINTGLKTTAQIAWTIIGVILSIYLISELFKFFSDIIVPIIVAGFVAVIFSPIVDKLENYNIKRSQGAFIATALIIAVLGGTVYAVVNGIAGRSDELSDRLETAQTDLENTVNDGFLKEAINNIDLSSIDLLDSQYNEQIFGVVGTTIGIITGTLLGLILLYYFLKDSPKYIQYFENKGNKESELVLRIIKNAAHNIRSYNKGIASLALIQGIFAWIGLLIIGVPLAATIGLVNFIGAFIPYLGAFVGGLFAVVIAFSEGGITMAIIALAVVVIMNVALQNLLEPYFIGSSLKLSPVVVLIATIVGAKIAGLLGLVLAAPTVAISINIWNEVKKYRISKTAESLSNE